MPAMPAALRPSGRPASNRPAPREPAPTEGLITNSPWPATRPARRARRTRSAPRKPAATARPGNACHCCRHHRGRVVQPRHGWVQSRNSARRVGVVPGDCAARWRRSRPSPPPDRTRTGCRPRGPAGQRATSSRSSAIPVGQNRSQEAMAMRSAHSSSIVRAGTTGPIRSNAPVPSRRLPYFVAQTCRPPPATDRPPGISVWRRFAIRSITVSVLAVLVGAGWVLFRPRPTRAHQLRRPVANADRLQTEAEPAMRAGCRPARHPGRRRPLLLRARPGAGRPPATGRPTCGRCRSVTGFLRTGAVRRQ